METRIITAGPHPTASTHDVPRDTLERVATQEAVWTVVSAWRDHILGTDAPDFFALEQERGASRIKFGRRRAIWRINRDGYGLVCKRFEHGGLIRRILSSVLGSPARREFQTALTALRVGASVPSPVAWARGLKFTGHSIVITEEVKDAVELSGVSATVREDRLLIEAIARLYAQAHCAGFTHLDGHPGNVLVRRESDGNWNAWFVDLHDFRRRGNGPTSRRIVRSLGQLEHHYAAHVSVANRLGFLVRYARQMTGLNGCRRLTIDVRALTHLIRQAAHVQAKRLARRRDRRLRTSGKYFARFSLAEGWRAFVLLTLARRRIDPAPEVRDRSLEEWREVLSRALADTRLKSRNMHAVRVDISNGLTLLVSTYDSFLERLRVTLWKTPARRQFEHAHRLRHRDLPAPIPLGYAERRQRILVRSSFILIPSDSAQHGAPQTAQSISTPIDMESESVPRDRS